MKVGLIGCGGIAPAHLQAFKNIEGVEIAGLCDLNVERAKQLASEFKVENVYSNYWDLFEKNKDLELVDICTPVSTHAKIVCDASNAVPAILVEKPMALNVSQCDEMINAVRKHGTKLCIGHGQIFSPNIIKAKTLVDSGKFDLFSFSTLQKESFELLKDHKLAPPWNVSPEQGGILWEVCTHLIYLQLHFLPDIEEVYAVGGKVKYPVYDDIAVLLRTRNERFGIIELSWISRETDIVFELSDKSGNRLQIHRDFDYFLEKNALPPFNKAGVLRSMLVDDKRVMQKWYNYGRSYLKNRKFLPIIGLINSYIENIKKDLPPPVTPEDGKNTIVLLEAIEKSISDRQPVKVSMS